jgi:archaellum component FlaF (FlaF/FlaG flagellin family)
MFRTRGQRGRGVGVPEHVRHDEESHVAAANVNLVEMGDTAIAGSDGDVLLEGTSLISSRAFERLFSI